MKALGMILIAAAVGGCAQQHKVAFEPIRHTMVVDLKDPADYYEFGRDCFNLMFVPGVVNVLTGPGIQTGQAEALKCDAGVVLDIDTAEACRNLPQQPAYQALIAKWEPRANAIRVASFGPRCMDPDELKARGTPAGPAETSKGQ